MPPHSSTCQCCATIPVAGLVVDILLPLFLLLLSSLLPVAFLCFQNIPHLDGRNAPHNNTRGSNAVSDCHTVMSSSSDADEVVQGQRAGSVHVSSHHRPHAFHAPLPSIAASSPY